MHSRTHITIRTEEKEAVILVGNSGSGKSTLVRSLGHLGVGFGYLGTGAELRKLEACDPTLAKIISSYTSTGAHVPREVILPLVKGWFMKLVDHRLLLADGFPRNTDQVDDALELFHEHGFVKVTTLFVDTPPEKCAQHLLLQAQQARHEESVRNDGTEEAMTQRLSVFDVKVKPILEVLEKRSDMFVRIDTRNLNLRDRAVVRDIALEAEIIH